MTVKTPLARRLSGFTSNIPPFPKAVQRVMTMLRDSNIQLTRVAEVVAHDQGFSGKVLRMANSAYFGLPRRVYNVTEALVLLGYAHVRDVLVSASVGDLLSARLEAYGLEAGEMWEHSVGSAYAAQMLSRKADPRYYSMAFSAGLLHDVDKVAFDRVLEPEEKTRLLGLLRSMSDRRAEHEFLGLDHAEAGSKVCGKWNLPEEIIDAVAHHHSPHRSSTPLAGIVAAADHFTGVLLQGVTPVRRSDFARAPEKCYIPADEDLLKLSEDLPVLISSARNLLQGTTETR
jgi:putative nucleotidyltransferase with HDIG domain